MPFIPDDSQTVTSQPSKYSGFVPDEPQVTSTPSKSLFSQFADFTGSAAKGIAEIALQPARFIERAGKGIGMIGLSPEQKTKVEQFMGPGLQESIGGKSYATPAYTDIKQAYGGAEQALANVMTPFAMTPGGMALQGGVLAHGKALEEGKTGGEALLEGTVGAGTSYGIGKASELAGGVTAKGKQYLVDKFKPVVQKIAPALTGVSKGEMKIAFNDVPELTAEKMKIFSSYDNPADARSALQTQALDKTKAVIAKAKEVEQQAFDASLEQAKQQFPDAAADLQGVYNHVEKKVKDFGIPVGQDAREALDTVLSTIRKSASSYGPSIDGVRTLSRDLWSIVDQTDEGTPAHAAAMEAWSKLRGELSKMTDGTLDPAMQRYAQFKTHQANLKPAWSVRADENQARNFVSNLESSAKTASRDSLKALEDISGMQGHATNDITINRLMSKLAKSEKTTGSRLTDVLVAGGLIGAGGMVGGAVGGEKGKQIGQIGGGLIGARALAPDVVSKILLSGIEQSGVPITSTIRKTIGDVLANPQVAIQIRNALLGKQD